MNYEYVIVGSGLSGCVVARKLANAGHKVLVVERRKHLGGNVFDEYDENGILIQRYGPHTFHTNNDDVIDFITRYADFEPYCTKCEAKLGDVVTPSPFNFKTIDQFYSKEAAEELKKKLLEAYPEGRTTILKLLNSNDTDIQQYAKFLCNIPNFTPRQKNKPRIARSRRGFSLFWLILGPCS